MTGYCKECGDQVCTCDGRPVGMEKLGPNDIVVNPSVVGDLLKEIERSGKLKLVGTFMGIKIFSSEYVPKDEAWSVDSRRRKVFAVIKNVMKK